MGKPTVTAPAAPHTAGILAMILSALGAIAVIAPQVAPLLPSKVSAGILVGGIAAQAITKGIQQGNTTLVSND